MYKRGSMNTQTINNSLTVCLLFQRNQRCFSLKDRKTNCQNVILSVCGYPEYTFLMAVQSSNISMSLSMYTMYGPKKQRHVQ